MGEFIVEDCLKGRDDLDLLVMKIGNFWKHNEGML